MSNNANTATAPTASATTPAKSSTPTSTAKGADDTKSIASTSTLYDAKDNKADSKKTKKGDTLGASSTAFSKTAKEQGWAAPTATRPSFG
ncbi:hypothetical protein OH76DRAFT_1556838 [Lentinus brumalis]|uniref:Uncharacterized protein n=1 Tax=Lentinus brumalis TaxID=2498619 RepID=A0A371D8I2_9APHY|nr:hypothetical protein OH76DRAFT_1556838 [Polyporus brumalis]